jgi:hypothetical protein
MKPIKTYRSLPKPVKTYRIRIICASDPVRRWYRDVTVSNADELRGEIENFCMELERKYPCAVRCESVEEIKEDKPT